MSICTTLKLTPAPTRQPLFQRHKQPSISASFHRNTNNNDNSGILIATNTQSPSLILNHHHRHLHRRISAVYFDTEPKPSAGGGNGGSDGFRGGNGGGDNNNNNNNNGNNGGEGDGNEDEKDENKRKNKDEALMALLEAGRSLESLPKDLKAAVVDGKIPGSIITRFLDLEKSDLMSWLMKFGGFKERLLADDLFLAKLGIECGVGVFTKTAAEYQKRKENFFNELEIVFADVVMAIIADFMLVYLPAPTVSLRPPLSIEAGRLAKFFHGCPDNAFQIALPGMSFTMLQRFGAIARNGAKLFAVGTTSSLVGSIVTNALINPRKAVDHGAAIEVENVPILSTSVAYGVYMAISSNLRYQILPGVIEQRILKPMLHQHKLLLSASCFAVRTGNAFLGSLLWVDCVRFIGIQKSGLGKRDRVSATRPDPPDRAENSGLNRSYRAGIRVALRFPSFLASYLGINQPSPNVNPNGGHVDGVFETYGFFVRGSSGN